MSLFFGHGAVKVEVEGAGETATDNKDPERSKQAAKRVL